MSLIDASAAAGCRQVSRFLRLWRQSPIAAAAPDPAAVHAELIARYSEPQRHYHTCDHIDHCLEQLDLAGGHVAEPATVEMALWFHDAVYDPRATDNEWQSAELFMRHIGRHADADFGRGVYEAILITTHREWPRTLPEKFVVDIDLSSFGLPQDAFDRNGRNIRAEYAHVPDAIFFPAHRQILESFQARPTFYFTEFFRARYEAAARNNVQRRLAEIRGQGY
jgi:predicted metal-dependent HD superfamily phosphohydrolase